jgi:hypothetical protein
MSHTLEILDFEASIKQHLVFKEETEREHSQWRRGQMYQHHCYLVNCSLRYPREPLGSQAQRGGRKMELWKLFAEAAARNLRMTSRL